MEAMTLDELKAQNAEEEEQRKAAAEAELNAEEESEDPEPEPDTEEEEGEEEGESEETEAWMAREEDEGGSPEFTSRDMAAMRHKFKKKLTGKDSEIEELRAKIEQMQQQVPAPKATSKRPHIDDYDDSEKYAQDLEQWVINLKDSHDKTRKMEEQREARARHIESAVEEHYERAATLATKSNISAEAYQASDLAVRQMVDDVLPGEGNGVADLLISTIGEGSEKVTYYLGRNRKEQAVVQGKLRDDPSGLSAAVYLGELKARVAGQMSRTSRANPPAKRPQGSGDGSPSANTFKRKYDKTDDLQTRIDIKREAKAAGINTKNW